jgi:putative addiction module killer protein
MDVFQVREYETANGRKPVGEWLGSLRDHLARGRITARLDRLTRGLRGDWKSVGGAVCELRIDHGPGYRVHYAQDGGGLILLLCGGIKGTQARDIEKVHAYWEDFQARSG